MYDGGLTVLNVFIKLKKILLLIARSVLIIYLFQHFEWRALHIDRKGEKTK